MALDITKFTQLSEGYSARPKIWCYGTSTDNIATIMASGYFNNLGTDGDELLNVNDLIIVSASDLSVTLIVTAAGATVTTSLYNAGLEGYAEVTISSAEILALRATPKTLVAAPGTGLFLEFLSAQLILDYNSVAYTESTDNMAVRYTNGSGVIVSQAIEATGFIDQTADTITNALPKVDAIVTVAGAANQALVLHNTGDGEYAAGNSTLTAKISYKVHATGL